MPSAARVPKPGESVRAQGSAETAPARLPGATTAGQSGRPRRSVLLLCVKPGIWRFEPRSHCVFIHMRLTRVRAGTSAKAAADAERQPPTEPRSSGSASTGARNVSSCNSGGPRRVRTKGNSTGYYPSQPLGETTRGVSSERSSRMGLLGSMSASPAECRWASRERPALVKGRLPIGARTDLQPIGRRMEFKRLFSLEGARMRAHRAGSARCRPCCTGVPEPGARPLPGLA
jgi:hypothetical protein